MSSSKNPMIGYDRSATGQVPVPASFHFDSNHIRNDELNILTIADDSLGNWQQFVSGCEEQ